MSDLREEFQIASQYSVDSKGKAIFYSGDNGRNHKRAVNHPGRIPLDRTDAGRKLDGIYQRNNQRYRSVKARKLSKDAMSIASHRYAQNARGDVKTFVCGAKPDSVFRQTELRMIANNKHITSINGVDRKHVQKAFKQDPTGNRAHRLVSLAELRQDRREAKLTGDKRLLADVKSRQNLYRDQYGRNKSNTHSFEQSSGLTRRHSSTSATQSNQQKVSRANGGGTAASEAQKTLPPKTQPPPQQSQKRGR